MYLVGFTWNGVQTQTLSWKQNISKEAQLGAALEFIVPDPSILQMGRVSAGEQREGVGLHH